jgi:hypothetical protein
LNPISLWTPIGLNPAASCSRTLLGFGNTISANAERNPCCRRIKHHAIKSMSDAAAMCHSVHVDCRIDGPAVSRAIPMFACISVADDLTITVRDQPGMCFERPGDPLRFPRGSDSRQRSRGSNERTSEGASSRSWSRALCGISASWPFVNYLR